MDIIIKEKAIEIRLFYENNLILFEEIFSTKKRFFRYEISIKGKFYKGDGIRGDDSIYMPYCSDRGIKLTRNNNQENFLNNLAEITNIIQKSKCEIFPKIYFNKIIKNNKSLILFTEMENVKPEYFKNILKKFNAVKDLKNIKDIFYVLKNVNFDQYFLDKFYFYMEKLKFFPEDEWYKKTNLINNKIVDFGRFKVLNERYKFPSNNFNKLDLLRI